MSDKILSIFIDESGDFGAFEPHAPYYFVSMVLHDQRNDIDANLAAFETHLSYNGYINHAVHTGPLIRREGFYANDLIENRKGLFSALFNFTRKLPISYTCVKVNKQNCPDELSLTSQISRQFGDILDKHASYFNAFDRIIIYYDNGQTQLSRIITSVFSSHFLSVEYRKVKPVDYRLFQVADMICTIELLASKAESKSFTRSEIEFFDSVHDFKKNYLKWLRRKLL